MRDKQPKRPYGNGLSARLFIRTTPEHKAKLVRLAIKNNTSVERLVNEAIERMEE